MLYQLGMMKVKWYGNRLMKTLYEYAVALFLWGAVFIFGLFNLSSISMPVTRLLGTDLSMKSISLYLIALNLIVITLFCCQRNLLFNSEFESYLKTLPITKKLDRLSSLIVLFVSNHLLWVILLIGAYRALSSQPVLTVVMEVTYLICSLLFMQLCLYEKDFSKLLLIGMTNLIFILAKSIFLPIPFNLLISILIVFNILIGFAEIKKSNGKSRHARPMPFLNAPVLSMQCAMLKPYQNQLLVKIGFCFVIQCVAIVAISHSENPNLVYPILLLNFFTMSLMSTFPRLLVQETEKMKAYFLCLPLKKGYWFKRHQLVNFGLTLLVLLPGMLFALSANVLNGVQIFYQWFSILVINATVYYIYLKNYRNTNLLLSLVLILLYSIQLVVT